LATFWATFLQSHLLTYLQAKHADFRISEIEADSQFRHLFHLGVLDGAQAVVGQLVGEALLHHDRNVLILWGLTTNVVSSYVENVGIQVQVLVYKYLMHFASSLFLYLDHYLPVDVLDTHSPPCVCTYICISKDVQRKFEMGSIQVSSYKPT
jgi:hypothetical protein